ncbi:MAG: DUF3823 domain-containing protein [Chitinophagaceae bacterium]|nr:DUF3823 domain-containing protein [Chitinophagaceae bacterium]
MNKLLYFISIISLSAVSCSKLDNYPMPNAALSGRVIDAGTKNTVQTEIGSGTRVKLEEISWSDNPTPFYFYSMQDGTFNNTKLFVSTNKISVEGAFVPLVQYDNSGNITVDQRQTVDLHKGAQDIVFEVEPLLRVEWVGDPVTNADSTITVKAKVTRGTSNPNFQNDVSDIYLFLNTVPYVGSSTGNNDYFDPRYSYTMSFSGSDGNAQLGQTITLTTEGKLPPKRSYWLRVGARTTYGLKQCNYTDIKKVTLP